MITTAELALSLDKYWDTADVRITVHNGGMGSSTWFVDRDNVRWVAKAVSPEAGRQFAGGLRLAQRLEQAGIPAGAPVPARTGALAVRVGNDWLALLTWVPGEPLTGQDDAQQMLMGRTLAQVHAALAGYRMSSADRFHWVNPAADHLSLRPWLRPAVSAAVQALEGAALDMRWGLLHADPAPQAFLFDAGSGRCGVIDWSYAIRGPLLYDLASAVMYVGGPEHGCALIKAYLQSGLIDRREVDRGLALMLRFRWAVQANYFAWRISTNDLTGIAGPEENEAGLEDARSFLVPRSR